MIVGLLRHGIAEAVSVQTDWQDPPRRLTDEGRRRMALAAQGIARLDLGFDVLVTSPLTRCRETALIVGRELNLVAREDERLAPGMDADGLLDLLVELPAEAVLVCGHEPDLSSACAELCGGGWPTFKKGTLALLDLRRLRPRAGTLTALYPPAALRRLGG